jgi:energy-coupling factor transporter transmembrane protein EcfT
LPDPFLGFAVAGSAAINLVPQTIAALTDIREATAARGYAPAGIRGVAAVVTPMINVGLDRSMRLAEVLESRGFGGRRTAPRRPSFVHDLGWTLLLGGAFVTGYGLVAGIAWSSATGTAAATTGAIIVGAMHRPGAVRRTRYRLERFGRPDWLVLVVSIGVAIACLVTRQTDPRAFMYEPYPAIAPPHASVWPLLALLGLFSPALVVSAPETRR